MSPMLFDLFKKSPFGPLHQHMVKVRQCMELLRPLFEAVLEKQDQKKIETLVKKISKTEHEADEIKNEIRMSLPGRIFLPVNREDLLAYLKVQDDIADSIEDVSVLLTLKPLRVPDALRTSIYAFVDKVLEVFHYCEEAEAEFERTVSSGFGEAERSKVLAAVQRAEHAEWEADNAQNAAAKMLFSLEDEMRPTDVFLLFKLFGELGKVANHAEKTGDRLRQLLVRS
jgi:uncharacterized protein